MRSFPLLILAFILHGCGATTTLPGETQDEILLTINSTRISPEEFLYSFSKSHQNEDSITASAIDEYLKLFVNYKLKVSEARKAGYDTVKAYKDELAQYQEQLKSTYRVTDQVVEKLKKEAYERLKEEVKVSHILIMVPENSTPEDTLKAYNELLEIREKVKTEDFNELAFKYSEDPSAQANKGNLGYFTAFQMLYSFENAAYNTPVGEVSNPIRTRYGYHILKIHDRREATGKFKLKQLLLSAKSASDSTAAANLIFELHEMLKTGLQPEQVIASVDNELFNIRFGPLPALNYSQLPKEVQVVMPQLQEKGNVSDPVQAPSGEWYIFIFDEKVPQPEYSSIESQLDRMVRRNDRLQMHQEKLIERLYEKHSLELYINNITDTLKADDVLFTLSDKNYTYEDFENYINGRNGNSLGSAYQEYIKSAVMEAEDKEMILNNPELKWLLKEYEEGMLLFTIMEDSVWNKAVNDVEGREQYLLKEDAVVNTGNDEFQGNEVVAYQEYLEEKWVSRLRKEYKVVINQRILENLYEELLD